MATFNVEGDDLVVTPEGGEPLRLSLVLPFEDVEKWDALGRREDNKTWLDEVRLVRPLMPASARAQLDALADGALLVQCVREWQRAFADRLGKHLLFSGVGAATE